MGELSQTVVRPQEVLAAMQELAQAYTNYFTAIADFNRAQFRLYRTLGQPAEQIMPLAPQPPRLLPRPKASEEKK